jgi:hypothetical protein
VSALNVVPFRDVPSLMDLPGRLRWLADEIERSEVQNIQTMLVLQEDDNGEVSLACFGVNPSRSEISGLLLRAAMTKAGQ